jgi:hypothetical protein
MHLLLVEDVGQVAATAVLAVLHGSHEDTSAASVAGALASKSLDLAIRVDLVVLEDGQLGLLALVLDLLGGGVDLLLALLGTTTKAEHQVEGRLLLDVVVAQGAAILQLLASEDQALLIRGNALLVLDLRLDVVDSVGRLHLKGDSLPREGLDENLHLACDSTRLDSWPLASYTLFARVYACACTWKHDVTGDVGESVAHHPHHGNGLLGRASIVWPVDSIVMAREAEEKTQR